VLSSCPLPGLLADGNKLMVTDLGSTNGTEVDGAELAPMANTEVPVGSMVTFGG
jgi:pSer/pThr/pTyr-binding forkhead associated (FHA) protein